MKFIQFTMGGYLYKLKDPKDIECLINSIRRYLFLYQTHDYSSQEIQIDFICNYFDLNSHCMKGFFKEAFRRKLTFPASKYAYRLKFNKKGLTIITEEQKRSYGCRPTEVFKIIKN